LLLRNLTAAARAVELPLRSLDGDRATALRMRNPMTATATAAGTASRGPDSFARAPPVTWG